MRMDVHFEAGLREKLQKLARDFGDDADQATARLAVSVARELAILAPPRGKDKKTIIAAIVTQAWRVVIVIQSKFYTHLMKSKRPRINMGKGGWQPVSHSQFTKSDKQLYDHIESHRDGKGHVREYKNRQLSMQLITTRPAMNKVITRRRKLAGAAHPVFNHVRLERERESGTPGRRFPEPRRNRSAERTKESRRLVSRSQF